MSHGNKIKLKKIPVECKFIPFNIISEPEKEKGVYAI